MIDGVALGVVNVGFAWPTSDAALKDAMSYIDQMIGRKSVAA